MLSKQIYELRQKNGLSREQMAEMLGVSPQTVAQWESGVSTPAPEKITEISEDFHVTPEDLTKDDAPHEERHEKQHAGHHGRHHHVEDKKAAERRIGVTLCFAGAVCMILLLAVLFLLPEAGQQLKNSSAVAVDGSGLLILVSVLSMVAGLVMVLRNQ